MKHIIIFIIVCLASLCQAQVKINIKVNGVDVRTNVDSEIASYSAKIDSLVQHEKRLMKEDLEKVNARILSGEITEAEGDILKEEIAEIHAENIEEGVEALAEELESIIEERVEVSLYEEEEIEGEVEISISKKKYKKLSRIIWTTQLGFSNLSDDWDLNASSNAAINFGKSVAFTFGPLLQHQPTITSPFTLISGLQFRSNNIRADRGSYFYDDANEALSIGAAPYAHPRKAKLRVNSLQIPLGFKYSFRSKEVDDENEKTYRNVKKGFYLGLMGYGGLNLSSRSIVKYYNDNDHRRKDKFDINSVNNLFYGIEFDFGFKGYNFYFRKDLSDYFDKTTLPVNQNFEFGMRFGY